MTILAPGSAGVQSLSSAYTLSFPHWVLDGAPAGEGGPAKIPTEGDDGGWVQPFSLDELWMASDLPEPRTRLALGALVKDGQLRCVFPALDTPVVAAGKAWRNRGLSSVPLAKVWLDFTTIPLEQLSVSAFSRKEGADWVPMGSERLEIQGAVNRVIEFIADPPPGLERGFALVTATLDDGDLPSGGLSEGGDKIRVFLTDYPDPGKLLDLDVEACGAAVLDIVAMEVASGAGSEYLPDVYRELFESAKCA